jgi:hypothetical protein
VATHLHSSIVRRGNARTRFYSLLALALLATPAVTFGQARDFHSQRLVLDDNSGNKITLQTPALGGSYELTFPASLPGGVFLMSMDGTGAMSYTDPSSLQLNLPATASTGNASTLLSLTNTGAGAAGLFAISNTSNGGNALTSSTDGSGYAASFTGSGTTSHGIIISTDNGNDSAIALSIDKGQIILASSSNVAAAGGTIPNNVATVIVDDDGTGAATTVSLPTGTEGQIIYVTTDDPDGVTVNGGVTIDDLEVGTFMYLGGAWRREH